MKNKLNEILSSPDWRAELEVRFWAKVDRRAKEECWPWTAKARHMFGYGVIAGGRNSGPQNAHCVAWGLSNGMIPSGAHILHSCDNPWCCNPGHLYAGSDAQNKADMLIRGRHRPVVMTEEIREKIKAGRAKNPPKQTERGRLSRAQKLKARWADPKWRARFSELMSGPNNHRFGKRPPEHQLEAVRRGHRKLKGYRHSEETKERMRAAALRRYARPKEQET